MKHPKLNVHRFPFGGCPTRVRFSYCRWTTRPASPTLKHASRTFEDVFSMPMPVGKTLASGLFDLFFAGDCVWSDVHFGFKLLGFDFFDFNYVLGT